MTGLFLQVRLDSSRLPRKALLPLGGTVVVSHAMRALRKVDAACYALLTDEESAGELAPYAEAEGFSLFVGEKEDVLKRYSDAARYYRVDRIIRATGDNPLVSGSCAREICRLHLDAEADYSGFVGLPLGTGVECVETSALLEADRLADSRYDREHVCPYLYRHPEDFLVYRPEAPQRCRLPDARVTLDTKEDYARLQELYRIAYRGRPIEIRELIHTLTTHQPIAG